MHRAPGHFRVPAESLNLAEQGVQVGLLPAEAAQEKGHPHAAAECCSPALLQSAAAQFGCQRRPQFQ